MYIMSLSLNRVGKAKEPKEVNTDPTERHFSAGWVVHVSSLINTAFVVNYSVISLPFYTYLWLVFVRSSKIRNSLPSAKLNSPLESGQRSGKSASQSGIETLHRKSVESMTTQRFGISNMIRDLGNTVREVAMSLFQW